ncbi:MAG: 50S ribosomal protein L11 methyltransferase [Ardenticatenaceae bacterium]|nr:50S ribosomal protein L11 methyltransferase [Ardenticatenaceae bacterium]
MYWLEVSIVTDGEGAEAIAEALRPFAYNDGVVLEQLGDMNDLDPEALDPAVTVKIYLPEDEDTPEARRRIEEVLYHYGRLYPLPPPTFRKLQEEDWANAWKAHYHPFRVGQRLWIQPSWEESPVSADPEADGLHATDLVITLDPGMAFGTGLHPTTQMCLQALEDIIQPGMRVLDVGTGSGILAIAAAKLGAVELLGVDTDHLAVQAALENVEKNGGTVVTTIRQGTLADVVERDWDVVVVNILAPVIITLLSEYDLMHYVAPGGRLILSGIIDQQAEAVETAVRAANGRVQQQLQVRDWVSYVIGHQE